MKTKLHNTILFTLAIIGLSNLLNAQNFVWAKAMGGLNNDSGSSIALDASGNVYTTGTFQDTVDFDPGAGTYNLTSNGNYDIFISKLDAAGNFVWAKNIGGTGIDLSSSIAIDAAGNVYTTGSFYSTADFDPGSGTFNLTAIDYRDIFISKLDASGNFIWAKAMGGTSSDQGTSIAVDATGNVFTTGYFFSSTVDFNPGAGTYNLTSAGSADIFVSKLDASGNFVWANSMGGVNADEGNSITVDANGNVFTTGYFEGTADFNPGFSAFNLISNGDEDIFISKLNSAGNFVWAKKMGGINTDNGNSITLDASGNVITTGYFTGTIDFDPGTFTFNLTSAGGYDIFISKLDAAGNFVWAKKMGGTDYDKSNSLDIDAFGNVFTTGYFFNTVDFDPGTGTFNLTSAGSKDIFISKLDAAGNFVWAKAMGSISDEAGNSIVLDATGNVFTTGSFGETVDFDPGAGTLNLTSAGIYDIFVHKMTGSTVDIEENMIENPISVYPNPNNGLFKVELPIGNNKITIFDVMGQVIYSVETDKINEIDLSNQPNGIYFLKVENGEKEWNKKVVKN